MPYTLGQAAKATGLSKPTLSEAIKKGRISARKNESGSFEIDPAELHRVYPLVASPSGQDEQQTEQIRTPDLTAKIMVLEARLEALGELKDQIAAERDSLRAERDRLLCVIEEQAGSVKQLTYKPEATTTTAAAAPVHAKRGPWAILAAMLALAGGVAGGAYLMSQYGLLPLR